MQISHSWKNWKVVVLKGKEPRLSGHEEEMQSLCGSAGEQSSQQQLLWILQLCRAEAHGKQDWSLASPSFQLACGCGSLKKFMKVMSGPP